MSVFKKSFLGFISLFSLISFSATSHAVSGVTRMYQEGCKTYSPGTSRNLPPQFCFKFIGVPVWSEATREMKTLTAMNAKAAAYCEELGKVAYRVYSETSTNGVGMAPVGTSIEGGYVCLTEAQGAEAEKTYRVESDQLSVEF